MIKKLDRKPVYLGTPRGASPLFFIISPSPFKERGIKGVRLTKILIS